MMTIIIMIALLSTLVIVLVLLQIRSYCLKKKRKVQLDLEARNQISDKQDNFSIGIVGSENLQTNLL